jgi:hypothetical protein
MDTDELRTESQSSMLEYRPRRLGGLTTHQWVALIVMGGLFLAICAALALVVRSGSLASVDALATAVAGPTPTSTAPVLVGDVVPTPSGLYSPPDPQPLATPNAPSDLLWWDARYAHRYPILLDVVATQSPTGIWVRVIVDGEEAIKNGEMQPDGADLRVVVWDGQNWWEIPRRFQPRREKRGWTVVFHLQDPEIARLGGYYLYHGNPSAGPPPVAEGAPETSRLLATLADRESVEWGPEITWTRSSTATQRLVSPDGRIVIESPPGGPREDVRVRLRTVPLAERLGLGALPDYELHADPPPGPPGQDNVPHWDPPLVVTINWTGLPVDETDLQTWAHFAYNSQAETWYSVPIEFDRERGLTQVITDQP